MVQKFEEGDVVEITEEYSSYGKKFQTEKRIAVVRNTGKGPKFFVDGKILSRGINSTYKFKLIKKANSK